METELQTELTSVLDNNRQPATKETVHTVKRRGVNEDIIYLYASLENICLSVLRRKFFISFTIFLVVIRE